MKRFAQRLLLSLGFMAFMTVPAMAAAPSFCDTVSPPKPDVCNQISGPVTSNPVIKTISAAIQILSLVIGFASVIMIMVGGIRYVISNGDPQRVKAAKDTVMYSLVGIVIALSAQLIILFILNKL